MKKVGIHYQISLQNALFTISVSLKMKALLQLFLAVHAEPIISIYKGMDKATEARTTSPVYGWQCPALDNPPGNVGV